uniref:MUC1 isoform T1 n=1 Tax=Homo sapiens TaxID=9606 RepID=A5YRU0_HUMAN|nr:MUC1 isoform T1 [Homo sapiens]
MTPGTQSPFFLLLLLTVLTATTAPKPATVVTGSGHASSTPGGEKETSATQRSSVPSSTEKNAARLGLHRPSSPQCHLGLRLCIRLSFYSGAQRHLCQGYHNPSQQEHSILNSQPPL